MVNMAHSEHAVRLRNAVKSYGGKDAQLVLNHLNMTVPKGSIYGLLGASGCGKTTLLGCISGRLKLNQGDLLVLGGVPGTKGSGVPGPRIGYMPQEVALVDEFDVQGAIYYFGWLFGMSNKQIAERYAFLSGLLQLPPSSRLIKDLSGGQSRRVSFAAALIQTPELLILDEPTVGLDPVLRQNIWDYLVTISRDYNMTIIITTHYIEEARQADKIGLMREGMLLAERSPNRLIAEYNCSTLEEVFLILSRKQGSGEFVPAAFNEGDEDEDIAIENYVKTEREVRGSKRFSSGELSTKPITQKIRPKKSVVLRMKALLYKNFLRLLRNTGGLFFLFLFPIIEISAFFTAVGGDPHNLYIGIVNDELGNCNDYLGNLKNFSGVRNLGESYETCEFYGLSCLYMSRLNDGTTVNIYYDNKEAAFQATRNGITQGVLHFASNFSESLEQRERDGTDATNETLDYAELKVWLDMSNSQIGVMLEKHLLDMYLELAEEVALGCNISEKHAQIPVKFNDPVFGTKDPSFAFFMAPGMVISMVFFLSVMLTATVIIIEKTEGVWDRNLVAGVTTAEILASHLIVQVVSMAIQMAETLLFGFFLFGMHCYGSVLGMLVLVFMQSLCGVSFGLLVSVICPDLTSANYFSLGSFYPYILLSGLIWPLEGMPYYLRFFSNMLPGTWATTSLRNILERGWGWSHPQVWPGFVISSFWIVLLCTVSGVLMKRDRK